MKGAFLTLAVLFTLTFIVAPITEAVIWFSFKGGCSDYLKLAGDAPTVERATEYLGKAVNYIETKGLTSGNSAYFIRTPRNDIGIWYNQIKGAHETVKALVDQKVVSPGSVSQLTEDNALMKIREVVLDEGSDGVEVTLPQHIYIFPNQVFFLLWYLLSLLFAVIFWLVTWAVWDRY